MVTVGTKGEYHVLYGVWSEVLVFVCVVEAHHSAYER